MKMFNKILVCSSVVATLAFSVSTIQAQNLVNGDFDTYPANGYPAGFTPDPITVAGVDQGWATFNNQGTAAPDDMGNSLYSPLSGTGTMLETVQVGNNWNPAGTYQIISGITPGQQYTFHIWGLTDTANQPYAATAGVLVQLGFETAALGGASSVENPGGTVGLDFALPSSMGVWTEYTVSATAPAGYTDAIVYAMFQDNSHATSIENLYFDNASIVPTPEPTTLALAGLGGAAALAMIRRRKS
jgi:PEP-CTERM motif